jgi:ArsR family transcriptional regulator
MGDAAGLLSGLSDPTRLAALRLLRDGREYRVRGLTARLGASRSSMARRVPALRHAGFVRAVVLRNAGATG